MYKILIKYNLLLIFPIIAFSNHFAYAHRKFEIKNKPDIEVQSKNNIETSKKTTISIKDKMDKNFEDFQSFEDSVKPSNQFLNLFGVGGFADQRLKNSAFKLWDIFEEEMSNQVGNKKINGTDINNTYDDSLKTLGN
tara:strand:+ start:954 stop:1364 length:411 start_codon:yes stop_codon:yes gene_type:complete